MNKLIRILLISLIICILTGCEQEEGNKWVKETPTPTPSGYNEAVNTPIPTVGTTTPEPTPVASVPLVEGAGIHEYMISCHSMGNGLLSQNSDTVEAHLYLINKLRTSFGLSELVLDDTLSGIAAYRTAEMVTLGYFNHYHPGYVESEESACVFDVAYFYQSEYTQIAENIARFSVEGGTVNSQFTKEEIAEQFFVQFCNSSEHYENIVNPDFTKVGLCVFSSGDYALITQIYE